MKQKQKRWKARLVAFLLLALITINLPVPKAQADSFTRAKATLSTSNWGEYGTSTIAFTTGTTTPVGGWFDIEYETGFGAVATSSITCPANTTEEVDNGHARCVVGTNRPAGDYTITIADVQNPVGTGSMSNGYYIYLKSYNDVSALLENTDILVAIVDDVVVTAKVTSILEFEIAALNAGEVVNTETMTGTSTSTTIPFGTLGLNATTTIGQELTVHTNAREGFTVTVEQDQNLTSDTGADIDSFDDAVAVTGAGQPWSAPAETLDVENTYGHFGLTSQDSSLSDVNPYGDALYRGFASTTPVEVMYHTAAADGSTDHIGLTRVGYRIEISSLQEAGDYTNTLTYICTPTF